MKLNNQIVQEFIFLPIVIFIISCTSTTTTNDKIPEKQENTFGNLSWDNILQIMDEKTTSECSQYFDNLEQISFEKGTIPDNTRTKKYIKYEDGCFVINLYSDIVYKYKKIDYIHNKSDFIYIYYYDFLKQKKQFHTGSYFNVNNNAVKYSINLPNEINTFRSVYIFPKPGKFSINVSIGEMNYPIDISIAELPFDKEPTLDELIEKMGFPDKIVEQTKRELYGKLIGGTFISGHYMQYFYKEYPYLEFQISAPKADKIESMNIFYIEN